MTYRRRRKKLTDSVDVCKQCKELSISLKSKSNKQNTGILNIAVTLSFLLHFDDEIYRQDGDDDDGVGPQTGSIFFCVC